jgi:hypothetical protein
MFFSDAVRSFTNLWINLRPGGRITFVCWRTPPENPWMWVPVQAAYTVIPAPPPAPPEAPGPFSLAARARLEGILKLAGFVEIAIDPFDAELLMATPEGGLEEATQFAVLLGPTARVLDGANDEVRGRVITAVRDALRPHVTSAGVTLKGATWLVTAKKN